MAKTIAVVGATGSQGNSIAKTMAKEGWNVRAITRKPDSDAAKGLKAAGATVVQANSDDEASLVKAFDGAHAIFAVTNFWEFLFTGHSTDESGKLEAAQAMKLARAAAKTPTLEHYLWSTLPHAGRSSNGKWKVMHLDYKADVDEQIRKELPDLAKKTTFMYFGYYPQNMAFFPNLKPLELSVNPGTYIQIMPTRPNATIGITGDMETIPGQWTSAILAQPQKTLGKYVLVAAEFITFGEMLKVWGEVMGRKTAYVETTTESITELWGPAGEEMALQFKWGEEVDWSEGFGVGHLMVSKEELGIKDCVGFRATIEKLKPFWQ